MTPISDEQLAAMEAKANAATPGEWKWNRAPHHDQNETQGLMIVGARKWDRPLYVIEGCADIGGGEWFTNVEPNDAEYIEALQPSTLLALIAEVRESRKQPRDADAYLCMECCGSGCTCPCHKDYLKYGNREGQQ